MKKLFLILTFLFISSSSFAGCNAINLGFVRIVTGTYVESVFVGYDADLKPMYQGVETPCSAGNRWQWFWE